MIEDFREELKVVRTPARKTLTKKGTLAIGIVETTPVVWQDELLRFEWVRNNEWGAVNGITREVGCYRLTRMADNAPVCEFAQDHAFGCCHAEDGVMYAYGVRGEGGGNVIDAFWSSDLQNWEEKEIIRFDEGISVFNNSVCKGPDGYIMAIEIHGETPWPKKGFTCVFAKSTDLKNWELMDMVKHAYEPSRYTACPVLRWADGWYYMICLESMPCHRWVPYITRTRDFETFQMGHINPVMWFDDDDKIVQHPEWFTAEQLDYIANAANCNASDLDICEYNGKTVILYSWGNQLGKEFLAEAEYDGPMAEFLKSFYVD